MDVKPKLKKEPKWLNDEGGAEGSMSAGGTNGTTSSSSQSITTGSTRVKTEVKVEVKQENESSSNPNQSVTSTPAPLNHGPSPSVSRSGEDGNQNSLEAFGNQDSDKNRESKSAVHPQYSGHDGLPTRYTNAPRGIIPVESFDHFDSDSDTNYSEIHESSSSSTSGFDSKSVSSDSDEEGSDSDDEYEVSNQASAKPNEEDDQDAESDDAEIEVLPIPVPISKPSPEIIEVRDQSDDESEEGASSSHKSEVKVKSEPGNVENKPSDVGGGRNNQLNSSSDDDNQDVMPCDTKTPGTVTTSQSNVTPMIIDIDEDDSEPEPSRRNNSSPEPDSRYNMRKRSQTQYKESMAMYSDEEECESEENAVEIWGLPKTKFQKFKKDPETIQNVLKFSLSIPTHYDHEGFKDVIEFFSKLGKHVDNLTFSMKKLSKFKEELGDIFRNTPNLSKFEYRSKKLKNIDVLINILQKSYTSKHRPLHLVLGVKGESLREAQISALAQLDTKRIKFWGLELGDALWEDVQGTTITKLLENHKSTLSSFIIHGGFQGRAHKDKIVIQFPEMNRLHTLSIGANYEFESVFQNIYAKRAKVIKLDDESNPEPYQVGIKTGKMSKLKNLILGSLIEIEDLHFSNFPVLSVFRVGSPWLLSFKFPQPGSRNSCYPLLRELQLPDCQKDPSLISRLADTFPNLDAVSIFLPSVAVLRAFFTAFKHSSISTLHIKTQFDFKSTMACSLLGTDFDEAQLKKDIKKVELLKRYKHHEAFISHYNIELPTLEEVEGSVGIGALKSLKNIKLEHVPRSLRIPHPNEDKMWYHHSCRFLDETIGFSEYKLSRDCLKEIPKENLANFVSPNFRVDDSDPQLLRSLGFTVSTGSSSSSRGGFSTSTTGGVGRVRVKPSMIKPEFKVKPERE